MLLRLHPNESPFDELEYNRLMKAFEVEGRPQALQMGSVRWQYFEDNGVIYFVGSEHAPMGTNDRGSFA